MNYNILLQASIIKMSNEDIIYIQDILDYLGPDWVYEETEYETYFRYTVNGKPKLTTQDFTNRFPGFSFDMFKVGGIGFIIKPCKYHKYYSHSK